MPRHFGNWLMYFGCVLGLLTSYFRGDWVLSGWVLLTFVWCAAEHSASKTFWELADSVDHFLKARGL